MKCRRARAIQSRQADREPVPAGGGREDHAILPVKEFDEITTSSWHGHGHGQEDAADHFSNPRRAGIIAVGLDEDDVLIGVAITNGSQDVMLFSDAGKAVCFDEDDVRPMGRTRAACAA
jgi:DNA gyrase subunit A